MDVTTTARLDTPVDVRYLRYGGIFQTVLKQLMARGPVLTTQPPAGTPTGARRLAFPPHPGRHHAYGPERHARWGKAGR